MVYWLTSWRTFFTCKRKVFECRKPCFLLLLFILLFYILNNRGEDRGDATSRNPLPGGRGARQGRVQPGGVPALCGEDPQPQRKSTDLRTPATRRRRSGARAAMGGRAPSEAGDAGPVGPGRLLGGPATLGAAGRHAPQWGARFLAL